MLNTRSSSNNQPPEKLREHGVFVRADSGADLLTLSNKIQAIIDHHHAQAYLNIATLSHSGKRGVWIISSDRLNALTHDHDTLNIASALNLNGLENPDQLCLEIILAMSRSPVLFSFPSLEEFESAIRVRSHAARAAFQAELNFDTEGVERPREFWTYDPETSFTLLPNVSIIEAITRTIQPVQSNQAYTFSCFRASEYILTLALAQELQVCHPALHDQLEKRWSKRAIMGEEFQSVFLREYGSVDAPIPLRFYVPGERVWFKNPDPISSDVEGYEGSWLYYLGSGLFNNFWDRQTPYTIVTKCLEIYHWRHGLDRNQDGEMYIDESVVAQRVRKTLADPLETDKILKHMMKYRDPYTVYKDGGCIDATREAYKWVHPSTSDILIPSP